MNETQGTRRGEGKTQGVVYVAVGEKFIAEAVASAGSLKVHNPDLPVTLFADRAVTSSHIDTTTVMEPMHPKLARIVSVARSPYERTLSLDTDTYICGKIDGLFSVLEQVEFGIMPAPQRLRERDLGALGQYMRQVPLEYAQLNTGVMLYRKCERVRELFAKWRELYERDLKLVTESGYKDPHYPGVGDQAAFREAFYEAGLTWMSLPAEYNCVAVLPGYLHEAVKVLHGRFRDPGKVAAALNARLEPRVHVPTRVGIHIYYEGGERRTVWTRGLGSRVVWGLKGLMGRRKV